MPSISRIPNGTVPAIISHIAQIRLAAFVLATLVFASGCPLILDSQSFCNQTDCRDDNPCTVDSCVVDECVHTSISECCTVLTDCDDSDPCTLDRCEGDNTCVHNATQGCCNDDSDCSAGLTCENNECVNFEPTCTSDEDCGEDEICDVASGACLIIDRCFSDDDCFSGDCFVGICDESTGVCHSDPVACGEGEECVDGICKQPCAADADCAAPDACTAASCLEGFCDATSSCDDGLTCTNDFCDADTGLCANASNCSANELCDPSGVCISIDPCTSDADCPDDGLFCNGTEGCDPDSGLCISSGDPCITEECLNDIDPCDGGTCPTCDEDTNACYHCPPGYICENLPLSFTLTVDWLPGTSGECGDTFGAWLLFNAPTGTVIPSLQTGDSADGREGPDVLLAQFNFTTATTVEPTLTSIETFNITDFGTAATTLSAMEITGVTTINSNYSTNPNPFAVSDLGAVVDLGLTKTNSGFTISYLAAATAGTTDEMDLTLSTVSGAAINITSATANGIESLRVISNSAANSLSQITQTTGTSLTTITITGAQPLTLQGPVPAGAIVATAFTANLIMQSASIASVSISGGTGNDALLGSPSADTLSGGSGDDTLSGLAGADIITTGAGADVVSMIVADIGDIVTDFTAGADKFDWNTALSSTDGSVTTPAAATAFQSGPAGTPLSATATVFELTGSTVATQTAANVVSALGATSTNADTNANILFVVYTTGGGAAIWNWINIDANVEASELTLVATLQSIAADTIAGADFQ